LAGCPCCCRLCWKCCCLPLPLVAASMWLCWTAGLSWRGGRC
jgi:hypothetical protein